MSAPYIHHESLHDTNACSELVKILYELLQPDSVVDIGCGSGNFLKVFSDLGVSRILGYDGNWVSPEQRRQFLHDKDFRIIELESLNDSPEKTNGDVFDIAICLEVAEHLLPTAADGLIEFLTSKSDTVVFSAAVANQPGQNHINCHWPEYWGSLFRNLDYITFDPLRMSLWNNDKIPWYYSQNIFIACHKESIRCDSLTNETSNLPALFHPANLRLLLNHHNSILQGNYPLKGYASMLRKKISSYF